MEKQNICSENEGDHALKNVKDFWINFDFNVAMMTSEILLVFCFFFKSIDLLYFLISDKLY